MHDCSRSSKGFVDRRRASRRLDAAHLISEPRFPRYVVGAWCVWLLVGCGNVDEHAAPPPVAKPSGSWLVDKQAPTPDVQLGRKRFESYCAACHQRGGTGIKDQVPPLTGSPWVAGSETRLVRIVLHGLRGPIEIQGKTYNLEMPTFHLFTDAEIASVLSFVRGQYGRPSPPVTEATVSRIRAATRDRTTYWTVDELLEVP